MAADEITRESWRIAEELGDPVPDAVKLWQTVQDELRAEMHFPKMMAVAVLMKRWKETKNPHYVDAAVSICGDEGVTPTAAIFSEVAAVARLRINGSPAGTPGKVLKEGLLDKLLTLMMNLVVAGCRQKTAARKAQQWQRSIGKDDYKASVLDRLYTERMRNTGVERNFRDHVNQWEHWHKPTWTKIGDAMPDAPEHESGERR